VDLVDEPLDDLAVAHLDLQGAHGVTRHPIDGGRSLVELVERSCPALPHVANAVSCAALSGRAVGPVECEVVRPSSSSGHVALIVGDG
jgi:hypothetical protein